MIPRGEGVAAVSVRVMAEVFKHSKATLGARLVLLAIADTVDEQTRTGWPSIRLLQEKASLSEMAVHRAVTRLVGLKEVSVTARNGASSLYRIEPYGVEGGTASDTGTKLVPPLNLVPGGTTLEGGGVPLAVPRTISEPSLNRLSLRATQWPADFTLTTERAQVAELLGSDAASEWAKFKDHALKDGVVHKNWDAAWRYWCRRAPEFRRRRTP